MSRSTRSKLKWFYGIKVKFSLRGANMIVRRRIRGESTCLIQSVETGELYYMDENNGTTVPAPDAMRTRHYEKEVIEPAPERPVLPKFVGDRTLPDSHNLERMRQLLRDELRRPNITRGNLKIYGLVLGSISDLLDLLRVAHDNNK